VALRSRPLRAGQDFVRFCIIEVKIDSAAEPNELGKFLDYIHSEWFKFIFARAVA
jgi:hypothetical protein